MAQTTEKKVNPHSGHRQRLLEKIETFSLREHELLEALLYNAVPRQDTNALAHRLMHELGGLEGVFSATLERLQEVEGVGRSVASYLRVLGLVYQAMEQQKQKRAMPTAYDYPAFIDYVKRAYEPLKVEVLDVYMVGENGEITGRARFSSGKVNKVSMFAKNLLHVFQQYNPQGILLVHNHPGCIPEPSNADDQTTAKCQQICALYDVILCDHIIYGNNQVYSYGRENRLEAMNKMYVQVREKWLQGVIDSENP